MMEKFRLNLPAYYAAAAALALGYVGNTQGANLNLNNKPLFLTDNAPPLTMLVMGKDHKLYYEAYNDASDLDGDGTIEIGYKPARVDYYGYFDSHKCYVYSGNRFEPSTAASDKTCSGAWSGDFLNYLTTSRMDALRKVFYGGQRDIDTASETVLAGAFIPQDAHSWGKEYTSIAVDGYDLNHYAPLTLPNAGKRHLFAVTSLADGNIPVLRVLQDKSERIWEWVSKEKPVADDSLGTPDDYSIRILACSSSLPEINCQQYGASSYKPTGLLQKYGENDSMYFGLLTGSYAKNTSGGVLRKKVGSITDEIDPGTGVFTTTNGIIKTIDNLRIIQFLYGKKPAYSPGWPEAWITTRPMTEGEQPNWGNPIAEMMYEGLRYFAGKASPTPAYSIGAGTSPDADLGLPVATWDDPYASGNFPSCSKPFQIVISDINPSYDTDQLPGSYFSSFTGDVSGLNSQALADTISSHEPEVAGSHFIGQSGTNADGTPSAKDVTSLGDIRGLSPEEPTKLGGYYSASVAYFGHINDLHSADGEQKMSTFAVALASPLPKIEIPVNGQIITLVPFAKSAGTTNGCAVDAISSAAGDFQPTNQIVDFYAETVTPTYGKFRINYEDVEQGADHDMDAIVEYEYQVNNDGTVSITLNSTFASGCIIHHMGYVISGTTADGTYLEVRDNDTSVGQDPDYFLDTPPGASPGNGWQDDAALPLTTTRTFTPGTGSAATLLRDPLWYAAKWGSFNDRNKDNIPQGTEWDINNDDIPDNYFSVTNALQLETQLTKAFEEIIEETSSNSLVALNSGSISTNSHLYQARFSSGAWTGQVLDFPINSDGSLGAKNWEAADLLDGVSSNSRKIVTYKPSTGKGIPFRWPADPDSPGSTELDVSQSTALNADPATGTADGRGSERLDYIRGDEISGFRERTRKLGDIVHSSPVYVGPSPQYRYPDDWTDIKHNEDSQNEDSSPYSSFKSNTSRDAMVYVGANDGMLHAFDAVTGQERFAYVPNAVIKNLNRLTDPNYNHHYYVDGTPTVVDAFFGSDWHTLLAGGLGGGGQGIFALNITTPGTSESSIASKVLWEFTDTDDPDLGYTFSEPNIVRMHNGKWAVVFGNGYNNTENDGSASTTGNAVLFIVDAETGALIKKIDTGIGSDDPASGNRPNGLATVAPVDIDGDFIVDYIYGGDLLGNLWKFDVKESPNKWKVAHGQPLFTAKAADNSYQPITTRPQVGHHPTDPGSVMVYFGTGKYLETNDDSSTGQTTQTFYGIWDKNDDKKFTSFTRSSLLQQEIIKEVVQSFTDEDGSGNTGFELRVTTKHPIDWSTHEGWYMDLVNTENGNTNNYGEKQVSDSVLRNNRIIFTTLLPSDELCDFGGTGWLMELDAASGGHLSFAPFDLNNNGTFTRADYINLGDTDGDGNDDYVPPGGKKSKVGIISTPGIISGPGTNPGWEAKYTSGSTGNIEVTSENAGPGYFGRMSWIQLR
ncbi:fimbrial assembly protein [Nitrosococcus oceani ATCC 19707]|uniref:Fimbrial assembly protein n=2 Tax=Nitrosococcus oceani TaxID=1229 RepID=Q3J8W4_NITOC|nr:PilC/PilY family type IV pilus protein [Nitrosococcus oceani]ABA58732.1 fimbrial assembly protein [Nitrosococcus oceani ATCC 19707]EDZ67162.1 PQQ enzyme repeat domain protein [Nitrosococcus oceani AFC27]KFI18811.1 fimbrial assembly protein [Nitrosococcus oceani C-27]GEM19176.1 fimbrial assembly protein [Nitrosococcus oceani]